MSDIRKWKLAGMTGLLAVGMLAAVGCSSSDDKTGTGGSGGGHGGSSGTAIAPGALITDFSGSSTAMVGAPYFGHGNGWTVDPTVTASGNLHIAFSGNAATDTTMTYPYAYIGLPFNNAPTDTTGTGVTGVTFTASGTLTAGCRIQFSLVDQDHAETTNNGHCASADGCYPSAKIFDLPASPTEITVLFSDQTAGKGAAGAADAVNPAQILNAQWQLGTSSGVAEACVADITIDDLKWK
jgi:hypothetical protein